MEFNISTDVHDGARILSVSAKGSRDACISSFARFIWKLAEDKQVYCDLATDVGKEAVIKYAREINLSHSFSFGKGFTGFVKKLMRIYGPLVVHAKNVDALEFIMREVGDDFVVRIGGTVQVPWNGIMRGWKSHPRTIKSYVPLRGSSFITALLVDTRNGLMELCSATVLKEDKVRGLLQHS